MTCIGFSLGANVNRYFGVRAVGGQLQVFPDISPYGTIGEYGVFALIPQARLRYPVFEDKLVPYVIGGVGVAITDFNDRKPRGFGLSIQDQSSTVVAGTIGAGIEYFVADNIALGVEARYLFAPDPTLTRAGKPGEGEDQRPAHHLRDAGLLPRAEPGAHGGGARGRARPGCTSVSARAGPSS